ncbi:gamma-glutamylcysteine synthetase [Streptococcus loxodontisalivarius]|uniref:glutamate--cysteine ligase n=1 Tax=Streptococcus loxodontisalivarius TaxID=1349415 RepID=A0ABS2PW79_9STRE|nr:gamma-glutamylcysteine synthetase [Streptococcus loxodontisalivarius]MBM7643800.1 gamma-glutamylcysteine synthetase [Streptococcus loxodontisalivarius]
MEKSIELLREVYFKPLNKETDTLFVGIELEFPIVSMTPSTPTDTRVTKELLSYLVNHFNFEVISRDEDSNIVSIREKSNGDNILFEVSYNTIEFAFHRELDIITIENRFNSYMNIIQNFLNDKNHKIIGEGINPNWAINDNQPVKLPRYEMLMSYLKLSSTINNSNLHDLPYYGAFICGSQVQLDINGNNFVRVINAFNAIECVKAYLFANSEFKWREWDTRISRDIFWEQSMHGIQKENVGLPSRKFQDESDYFTYLSKSSIFNVERDGEILYFYPISVEDYFKKKELNAFTLDGNIKQITPQKEDISNHRSYHYQDLTKRGTIEFRSVCTQPLDRTFEPAAFHLGLFQKLDELENIISKESIYKKYSTNFDTLRKRFSKKTLNKDEIDEIKSLSQKLISLAISGLIERNKGEEKYLKFFSKVVDTLVKNLLY